MPVGFSSIARNLFLLGSSGAKVVTNFFKTIDQSAGTDGVYLPDEIKFNLVDEKYLLAGSAQDSGAKGFGWFEKRNQAGTAEWDVRVEATTSVDTTLRAMELDVNDNLIVVGKTADIPWIAKYSNGGAIDWQSTTNSGDVEYTGITSDASGNYYACGNTPIAGQAQAFVEKFDSSGNPGWGKSAFMLGRDVVLNKVAANTKGEVVAVGYLEDNVTKGYIVKINTTTGEVLWDRTINDTADYGFANPITELTDVYIDSNDQIYVVGSTKVVSTKQFIIKYTAEGNIIWQKQSSNDVLGSGANIVPVGVKSDGETEQTIVAARYTAFGFAGILLSKYGKAGDLVWRRMISTDFEPTQLHSIGIDADPSFYYFLYSDETINVGNGTPDQYTFGKVSSSGNGLGAFQYQDGTGTTIDYVIDPLQDELGRLSDGSVRNDSSDLITYPFNATKILFDDLATQVTNKKRQMDSADSFEYSGSPAIRPADFQELNLLGDVYSGSGNWLDQSGKGNDGVVNGATWNASGYFLFNNNSWITIPQLSVDTFTYEGWVYNTPDNISTEFGYFFSGSTAGLAISEGGNAGIGLTSGDFYYYNGSAPISLNTNLPENQWVHVISVVNGSSKIIQLYINGVLQTSTNVTNTQTVITDLGRYQAGNTHYWDGRVGEVRIYPRALTAAQVFQNYNATREKYTGVPASTNPGLTSTRTPA